MNNHSTGFILSLTMLLSVLGIQISVAQGSAPIDSDPRAVASASSASPDRRFHSWPKDNFSNSPSILGNSESAGISRQIFEATGGVTIFGNVIASDKPDGSTKAAHTGIVSFSTDGQISPVNEKSLGGCSAAVMIDGIYHNYYVFTSITGRKTYYHRTYSILDWKQASSKTLDDSRMPRALCTDGITVYGCFYNGKEGSEARLTLARLDLASDTQTEICTLPRLWNSCAFGKDGFIYAVDTAGDLLKVSPSDGSITKVGATGVVPAYISGAVIDPRSGRMFWTVTPEDKTGNLYEIDLSTARATKLCQFRYNDEIAGLFIPLTTADKAPAAPSSLQASFPLGSLSGNLSFKAPSTTFDGASAQGPISYTVYLNGKSAASGSTSYSASVSVPLSVPEADTYEISVILSNDQGESPKASLDPFFIGHDTPVAPEVTLSYSGSAFKVIWKRVTAGVNGGYIDASKVSYSVIRMPDSVAVAKAIPDTLLSDPVSEPVDLKDYWYVVTASVSGRVSAQGVSNHVCLGAITPPYSNDFSQASDFSGFTVIDANADSKRWFWSADGHVRMNTANASGADDWLISPPVSLRPGRLYKLSFDSRNGTKSKTESIRVLIGSQPSVDAMKTIVLDTVVLDDNTKYRTLESFISVPAAGKYYIGFHGVTPASGFFIYLDNLRIDAPQTASVPAPVDSLSVVPDMDCRRIASLRALAPSLDMAGEALDSISAVEIFRDGALIHTLSSVTPGKYFSFVDSTVNSDADHSYTLYVCNSAGRSTGITASAFIGMNKPDRVSDVTISETQPGRVSLSWKAPLLDLDGKRLPADAELSYYILDASNPQATTPIVQNLRSPKATLSFTSGSQRFFQAGVFSRNSTGNSLGVKSDLIAVGNPYTLPWKESFADAVSKTIMANTTLEGSSAASWSLAKDNNNLGVKSQDADNGLLVCQTKTVNMESLCFTGKIDLAQAVKPAFTFSTFNLVSHKDGQIKPDINEIDVLVRPLGDSDWKSIFHSTVNEICKGDTMKWHEATVGLDPYKGKTIQIGLKVKCKYYVYTYFDNLSITDHDSSVSTVEADEPRISVAPETLLISNAAGRNVSVITLTGALIHSATVPDQTAISLPAGIYIVRVGDRSYKTIIP